MGLQKNHFKRLYKRIWKKLDTPSPIAGDCGKLCNKRCCTGTHEDGMLLFPGEEELYDEYDNSWFHIRESNIHLAGGRNIKLLVCNGSCPRALRPLSCRIFPLTPYMNELNRVDFRLDLRGLGICPLVSQPDDHPVEKDFIEKIYRAFPPLLREGDIVELIEILSKQHDETLELLRKFHEDTNR